MTSQSFFRILYFFHFLNFSFAQIYQNCFQSKKTNQARQTQNDLFLPGDFPERDCVLIIAS